MPKRFFGYIEGYYGRLLSWNERALLIEEMRRLSLNTYIYAPKEDPWHRQQWKTPYPADWRSAFNSFVKQGKNAGITVIPGIAPGLSFDYLSKADYSILLKKCLMLLKSGTSALCLLMDDIPVDLPGKYKKKYSSLGAAHGELLTKLQADIDKKEPSIKLWFCPTVYNGHFMTKGNTTSYLDDLALYMPEETMILWTGTNVISEKITGDSIKDIVKLFGNNICIWDNIYANDYCPNKLFAGPYINRSIDLQKTTSGILLNPTGLLHTDIFLLSLLAGYMNKTNPQKAWQSIASKLPISKEFKIIAPFINLPYSELSHANLSPRYLKRVKDALKKLIWQWKSPIQREWYPFLFMLDCDIKLMECKSGHEKKILARKKYPPVLADILCGK